MPGVSAMDATTQIVLFFPDQPNPNASTHTQFLPQTPHLLTLLHRLNPLINRLPMPPHTHNTYRKRKFRLDSTLLVTLDPLGTHTRHLLEEEFAQSRLLVLFQVVVVCFLIQLVFKRGCEAWWRRARWTEEEFGE